MSIQWYPGHMAKAKKKVEEGLKLIDVVIELLDARIPLSSRNPDIEDILADKKRIIVLNKRDLADQKRTKEWKQYLADSAPTLAVNSLTGAGVNQILNLAQQIMEDKLSALADKGRKERDIRLMIVGIPNVGKSQLINQLSNKKSARTGNRPGVTKGQQWVKLRRGFELLDTPGILWPKFEDEEVGFKLAITGAIKENLVENELLAYKLVEILQQVAPNKLKERFNLNQITSDTYQLIADIGRKRGCLQSGGRIDRERTSKIIIKEFQEGKFGKLTLELPPTV
ncbi:ribosome biogenesis GTPase YlqF [Natroniella sulfidigena]|uniref:ribosome biogenesis GTPase YlqF n=1 Tax=Natroniella sulfidigena TaxID=723921 RepID=UPI00200A6C46|nr:ribosome biogenesis GTPase YlqF [Natroniella sulfidigena]MCK8816553.1 ribosome biogenesis GTPase YlqF [Natroniella sulfidigena]